MTYVDLPGDLAALDIDSASAFTTPAGEMPRPLGWALTLDLGGCDIDLINDRRIVADWGARLCAWTGATPYGQPVIDFFGTDDNPGLSVRFRLDQPVGWRGIPRPARAEAVVRCDPTTNGVHIDLLSQTAFDPGQVEEFCRDYFAARSGTGTYRPRQVPSLVTGFRYDWRETP